MISKQERQETREYLKNHTEPEWLKDELLRAYDAIDEAYEEIEVRKSYCRGQSQMIETVVARAEKAEAERDALINFVSHDNTTDCRCCIAKRPCDYVLKYSAYCPHWSFDYERFAKGGASE